MTDLSQIALEIFNEGVFDEIPQSGTNGKGSLQIKNEELQPEKRLRIY